MNITADDLPTREEARGVYNIMQHGTAESILPLFILNWQPTDREDITLSFRDSLVILLNNNSKEAARQEAIGFAEWLRHFDNGSEHYNPKTKQTSESIGFSPLDCYVDEIMTIQQLYDKYEETKRLNGIKNNEWIINKHDNE